MANIDEVFGSGKTLKAADLDGDEITLTIEKVEIKEFEDDGEVKRKPIVHFLGSDKALVCNVTNSRVIAEAYGKETDGWQGKSITLFPTRVEFSGKLVDAIRVRILKPKKAKTAEKKPWNRGADDPDDFSDKVPF